MRRWSSVLILGVATLLTASSIRLGGQQSTAPTDAQVARLVQRMLGTWELNIAKSQFFDGQPLRRSTIVYERALGDGVKATTTRVSVDGTPSTTSYTASFNDKDYPYTGDPNYDALSRTLLDEFTADAAMKKAGRVLQMRRQVVSRDGKVMTITFKNIKDNGDQMLARIAVYEKVER